MENLLKNVKHPMSDFEYIAPQYDDIILSDEQKHVAITKATARKARILNKPVMVVQLTMDEYKEALRLARRAQQGILNEIAYANKLSQPKVYPSHTAEELAKMVIASADEYVTKIKGKPTKYTVEKFNKNIIWKLAQYFTDDPRFESPEGEYSLNKGIMLVGPVGCGKTLLMNLFRSNQKQSYKVVGCQTIGYEFAKSGFEVIINHSGIFQFAENKYGHTEYGTCYDDLGADEKRKYYGDRANALGEIMESRYRLGRHHMTHITTNLDGADIEEFYGLRARSRMREMFNIIAFDHLSPDMRK